MAQGEDNMRPWSYSRLSTWETCPAQYRYSYIEKLPGFRPESPAANRGTLLHEKADLYLKGEIKIYPPEFQRVATHLMSLKAKKALSEEKLAAREDWSPCEYKDKDAYFRAIIDVLYMEGPVCNVEDHKTGQVYDSHAIQLSDYVAIAAAHYPDAEEYRTRLIYVDQGIVTKPRITEADRVKPIRLMLDGRIKNAEEDTIFPTRAGSHCKWCDYSRRYGGPCSF
jgi:hypothetical protein